MIRTGGKRRFTLRIIAILLAKQKQIGRANFPWEKTEGVAELKKAFNLA